jgi:type-F conjugative transfer system secretin TraK
MITKLSFFSSFLFFLLTITTSSIFAEEVNKVATSQSTTSNKSDQRGTSGIDAVSKTENDEQKTKSKKIVAVDYSGAKEIPFDDNEQIKVVLSNRDINRVLVIGDKIKTIHGPTGLYTAKNDPSDLSGSAYISIYSDTSFTVFLATVKGHNLSLLVTPKTAPGRTVILEPTTPSLFANNPTEADGYQKTLIDLISNMINLEPCEDYEYFSVSEAKKHKWIKNIKRTNFYNVADVTPIAFYRGEKLSGIISKISSRTRNPLTLKPSYFYQPGVKAVALSLQILAPLEECWLYQIIDQN